MGDEHEVGVGGWLIITAFAMWLALSALFGAGVVSCATPPRSPPLELADGGEEDFCSRPHLPMTLEERRVLCGPREVVRP